MLRDLVAGTESKYFSSGTDLFSHAAAMNLHAVQFVKSENDSFNLL